MQLQLPRLIGITGKAGSGKDTLADHLVQQYGFHKYSLSSPIKKLLNERFGMDGALIWEDRVAKEAPHWQFGFDGMSGHTFSPRSWAQWLGTEAGRMIHGDDCWVNMMEQEWRTKSTLTNNYLFSMVVPDVRFNNEAARIKQLGGVVIHVTRSSAAPVTAHVTEQGISGHLIDIGVSNDESILTYLEETLYELKEYRREASDIA